MNIRKFNERMGRPKYSRGGYIKKLGNRKYFDSGGIISNAAGALGMNAGYGNITPGTNAGQLSTAYNNAQGAIGTQQGLTGLTTGQVPGAIQNQNTVANQELAMTQGAGPNPALNQLAQTTGQNVNQEAALLAGQRGAGANVGLAERNIGQVGAQTQEQAAGQAATLEAQQQIAAQQNLANLSGQQVGQAQTANTALNTAAQNEQNILQNANTSQNQANVGMQSNVNSTNAQTNQGLLGGVTSGLGAVAGLLNKGGEVHPDKKHKLEFIHKMTKLGMDHFDDGGAVASPTPIPQDPFNLGKQFPPSDYGGNRPIPEKAKLANGGMIHNYADGGSIGANPLLAGIQNNPQSSQVQNAGYNQIQGPGALNVSGGSSGVPVDLGKSASSGYAAGQKFASNHPMIGSSNAISDDSGVSGGNQWAGNDMGSSDMQNAAHGGKIWDIHPSQHAAYSANHFSQYFSKGGESKEVKAMVSPGERYWNPEEVERIKHGADPMKLGKIFPGKDKVPGKDSLKNDTFPTTLEEGGIVNPLHIEKKKNSDKSRIFVLKSLRATGKHMKKPAGMKS